MVFNTTTAHDSKGRAMNKYTVMGVLHAVFAVVLLLVTDQQVVSATMIVTAHVYAVAQWVVKDLKGPGDE